MIMSKFKVEVLQLAFNRLELQLEIFFQWEYYLHLRRELHNSTLHGGLWLQFRLFLQGCFIQWFLSRTYTLQRKREGETKSHFVKSFGRCLSKPGLHVNKTQH